MLAIQNAVLSALLRAQAFILEYLARLGGVDLTAVRKRLDDVIAAYHARGRAECKRSRHPGREREMAEATIHKDTLIERGLPADFLEQLQTGVSELETSVSQRDKSRTRRMGATKGLVVQEQEGRSVLKVLDAVIGRALRGDPSLLAVWKGARAIHRRSGGAATSTTQSTPSATATQSAVSTTPTASSATAA